MANSQVACSRDQFESGIDTHNAVAFVLCHGGSQEVANKFLAYCTRQADPATAQLNEYGMGALDYLFEFSGISSEDIVSRLGELLA